MDSTEDIKQIKLLKRKEQKATFMKKYILTYKDEKIECSDCGKNYNRFTKAHHFKSKFHLNTLNILQKKQLI